MASNKEGSESSRKIQKLNLVSSPHRKWHFDDETPVLEEQIIDANGYASLIFKSPPPTPPNLLRRIGTKQLSGVGKIKVMLRISSGDGSCFFSVDKRKKQLTLIDPNPDYSSMTEEHRQIIAAPKMFTFDAIFTGEDSQTELCSSALTDIIHAVINGVDGCLFCFGQAGLGKTYTMLGTAEAGHTLGIIPCAITWLFRGINEQRQKTGARYSVRVSCLELTTDQEHFKDLLITHTSESERSSLTYIKDNPLYGTFQLQQPSELRVPNAERAAFYLDVAAAARKREDGNAHMLYTLHVHQYNIAGKGGVLGGRSKLHLIDIGNSEHSKSSGGIPLSGLGNVLLAIFNGYKHLPYRHHKLTQLLKKCLGSLTCYATMIAHISPSSRWYNDTLTTCQFASRIHHIRHRKFHFVNENIHNTGSSDSSSEEVDRRNTEYDPSSSDVSADTVIYVGPSVDDTTDGEHSPVYIANINSDNNRFIVGKALQGSMIEQSKTFEERNPLYKVTKLVKVLSEATPKQISPIQNTISKPSPAHKIALKIPTSKITDFSMNKFSSLASNSVSDEQWIDGPRISKSKVAEARHMLKGTTHRTETWIDGPMHLITSDQSHLLYAQHSSSYGFMDSYKKSMIRKWVENQSSQIQRGKHSLSYVQQPTNIKVTTGLVHFKDLTTINYNNSIEDDNDNTSLSTVGNNKLKVNKLEDINEKVEAKLNFLNIESNTNSCLKLKCSSFTDNIEGLHKTLDMLEDDDDDEEIVVPPPLPLIEPFERGISQDISIENLNTSHKNIIYLQSCSKSLSSKNEILEIIELKNGESVSMQDSCLQVTEADIPLSMEDHPIFDNTNDVHPLRILSQENLTVLSTLADSISILSESPPVSIGMFPQIQIDHDTFYEQENRYKFDQLARLHKLYQSKLALANVTNSLTYQRENSSFTNIRESDASFSTAALHPSSCCDSISVSDVPFNDIINNHASTYNEPIYISEMNESDKICDNCRQSMMKFSTASSCFRQPDDVPNHNLKEEQVPGNGASISDSEEYIEVKLLPTSFVTNTNSLFPKKSNERMIIEKSDIEEKIKLPSFTIPTQHPIITPSSLPIFNRIKEKHCNIGSSLRESKDDYDSGTDLTCGAVKLSSVTLSRYRTESSGYDSILRDSETSSIASDSSRETIAIQENHSGALGVLTSTLCGCFNGGTTERVRTSASNQNSHNHIQAQYHKRQDFKYIRTNTHNIAWHNIQDSQTTSAITPS